MFESPSRSRSGNAEFPATRWSLLAGAGGSPSEARAALEALCQSYWLPAYAYVRRRGHGPHDAEDLTQQFFGDVFSRWEYGKFRAGGGRFRSYVLGALKRFLAGDYRKRSTWKRGGRNEIITIDRETGESWLDSLADDAAGPDEWFDKHWASSLLERAQVALEATYRNDGKSDTYDLLAPLLGGVDTEGAYADVAGALGVSEAGARMAVFRLRKRFRQLVREEIEQTVRSRDDVEDELDQLFAILGS